jgi:PfaB family protein
MITTSKLALLGLAVANFANSHAFLNALYNGYLGNEPNPPTESDLLARAKTDANLSQAQPVSIVAATAPRAALAQAQTLLQNGEAQYVAVVGRAVALIFADSRFVTAAAPYAILGGLHNNAAGALMSAGLRAEQVGYIELGHLMPENPAEVSQIAEIYGAAGCAVGAGNGDLLLGLARAAMAIHHRVIPALPGWKAPALPELWANTSFYVATESKTWFSQSARNAAVCLADGHALLSAASTAPAPANEALSGVPPYLYLLGGADLAALQNQLNSLEQARLTNDLQALAGQIFRQFRADSAYVLALIAKDSNQLANEIARARDGLPDALATGTDWATPAGSYFAPKPLGPQGEVAFVYPGAFSSYPRMGQDMLHLFPQLYDGLSDSTSDLGRSVGDTWLFSRTLEKQSTRGWKAFRQRLEANPAAMMESGLTFAAIVTRVVREVFEIKPARTFGYSLGEGSMLWGMGVWKDGNAGSQDLHQSPLFGGRLFGRKETVREIWGLPNNAPDDFWSVYFLSATPAAVSALLANEPRLYLTHINTPNEVVIAGETEACKRVVAALGCEHLRAPFTMVIHCEPTLPDYPHFYSLHNHPVQTDAPGVVFYASADYQPTHLDQTVLAHNISRAACKMLDFPKLVERVYNDGARIFIELGPQRACARWVSETLGARPHLAVAINQPGTSDRLALLRMLARLAAHRVQMNLAPLYAGDSSTGQIATATAAATALPSLSAHSTHAAFLEARQAALSQLTAMLALQNQLAEAVPSVPSAPAAIAPTPAPVKPAPKPSVFNEWQIGQFATGSVVACFGEEYRIYENRRAPRIPNGDLLLVSRIMSINGKRHHLDAGSSIVSEYDMPATPTPWFFRDNAYPTIPYSVYMEMALQLCGFLSAYLGSTLTFPDLDFYFRNLDGDGLLTRDVDLRGKTIRNDVTMTSSITMQGIILQKFTFALSLEGETFYEGTASFGCFTAEAMANQVGLDKGKPVPTWLETAGIAAQTLDLAALHHAPAGKNSYRLSDGQLNLVDSVQVVANGGKFGKGYILMQEDVKHEDWFFTNHFFQDPVMPGSLGVEAIWQAMQSFALSQGLGSSLRAPRFRQALGHKVIWRYRGQVTRANKRIWAEIHIKRVEVRAGEVLIVADASLWRDDGLRIYEVIDAALAVVEA